MVRLDDGENSVGVRLSPGQAHDNPQLTALLDDIRVPHTGPCRPRKRPERVTAEGLFAPVDPRRAAGA